MVKCCGNAGVQGTRRDLREHLSHSLLFKGSTLGISLTQREKKKSARNDLKGKRQKVLIANR